MEEKEKFDENFVDFDEESVEIPELEQDLVEQDEMESSEEENIEEPNIEQDETQSLNQENSDNELNATEEEFQKDNEPQNNSQEIEINKWEEMNDENSVVKKYVVYISKDFVPYMDSLTVDERTAYINDAIQKKIDLEDIKKQEENKKRIKIHFILAIVTFCVMIPLTLLGVNKAIMATFENYKYSQDNFEKLYKQRFEKDKAYMRSLEYNKELEKRKKR